MTKKKLLKKKTQMGKPISNLESMQKLGRK